MLVTILLTGGRFSEISGIVALRTEEPTEGHTF